MNVKEDKKTFMRIAECSVALIKPVGAALEVVELFFPIASCSQTSIKRLTVKQNSSVPIEIPMKTTSPIK